MLLSYLHNLHIYIFYLAHDCLFSLIRNMEQIEEYYKRGCKCELYENSNEGCVKKFNFEEIEDTILSLKEYSNEMLDAFILGQLQAVTYSDYSNKTKKHVSYYMYHGNRVCRQTFCFVNTITEKKLKTLKAHFRDNGIVTRVHGNTKRLPKNTTSTTEIEAVKSFIGNYAIVNAINLPGRVPGYKSDIVSLLPTGHNKQFVHQQYCLACETAKQSKVSYWVFRRIRSDFFPNVFATQSRTDLCFECQKNISSVLKSRNKDEKLKSDAIQKHEEHLSLSIKQRSDYQTRCKNSQSIVENANITDIPNNVIPNSLVGEITYSLDFAQQISYPNNPDQAGELFFKVPRKCLLFGIVNEGLQKQVTCH